MDRRDFLRLSAIGLAGLGLNPALEAASVFRGKRNKDGSYSVIIFGDTHYDTAPDTYYHTGYSDPNPKREANHRKEFVRNAEMWSDKCPRLVKRASCLADDNTKLVLQTGDLIQGDTATAEIHIKMLDDAFSYIKQVMGDIPLVTVAGNHDLRGKDDDIALKGYLDYMPGKLTQELGTKVEGTDFAFRIGPDAFIAIDFTHPDDDKVARLLEETSDARYTFILCHAPVMPFDSRKYSKWYYHGKDKSPEARLRMRRLFAQREAIVLCGHTHTTELLDWYGEGGRITQMTMNSVWKSEQAGRFEIDAEGAEEYGKLSGGDIFDEIRPGIKTYIHSVSAGSYKMNISDKEITVDFYAGDDTRASKRFKIR